jgi:hypothetical protein
MSKKSETTCIRFLLDLLVSLWKSQPHSTPQLLSTEQVSHLGVLTLSAASGSLQAQVHARLCVYFQLDAAPRCPAGARDDPPSRFTRNSMVHRPWTTNVRWDTRTTDTPQPNRGCSLMVRTTRVRDVISCQVGYPTGPQANRGANRGCSLRVSTARVRDVISCQVGFFIKTRRDDISSPSISSVFIWIRIGQSKEDERVFDWRWHLQRWRAWLYLAQMGL